MKKIILGIYLFLGAIIINAQGLEDIIVEKYYIANQADRDASLAIDEANGVQSLPLGAVTYRIYVDMLPGYKLLGVHGNTTHKLLIKTSTFFYNNVEANASGVVSWNKTGLVQNVRNLDSYFSMGSASTQANTWGILKADDGTTGGTNLNITGTTLKNDVPEMGLPLTTADGLYTVTPAPSTVSFAGFDAQQAIFGDGTANGNEIAVGKGSNVISGTWYSLNGVVGPKSDNRVLVAQITTNGDLQFKLHINIQNTTTLAQEKYVANEPTINSGIEEIKLAGLTYPRVEAAPVVSFISPDFNVRKPVETVVPVKVDANDPDDNQIDSVVFYINNKRKEKLTSQPYQISYTTPSAASFTGQDTLTIVKVVAYDNDTLRTFLTDTLITDKTVTEIKNLGLNSIICAVYPNPVSNILTIKSNTEIVTEGNISVYNILGSLIESKKLTKSGRVYETIDMSGYPTGQYIIEILTGNTKTIKRIVKK